MLSQLQQSVYKILFNLTTNEVMFNLSIYLLASACQTTDQIFPDKEDTVTFWQTSASGFESVNFWKDFSTLRDGHFTTIWHKNKHQCVYLVVVWRINALASINEVNLHRARLVLR